MKNVFMFPLKIHYLTYPIISLIQIGVDSVVFGLSEVLPTKHSVPLLSPLDPNEVLDLLQSALSIEKLSNLLQEEHRGDSELLLQLQNRLEGKRVCII